MRRALATLLALGCVTAGCDDPGGGFGGKAGGPTAPVELLLVTGDASSAVVGTAAVDRFVDLVHELSDGALAVRVVSGPDGGEIGDVVAGSADLGWTGTQAFDEAGLPELRPFHTPFLIDSHELQAAVLAEEAPAATAAALSRLDLEPLALLAGGLRHVASTSGPLLDPDAWAGSRVWLRNLGIQAEAISALGGQPFQGGYIHQRLIDGTAEAMEVMWHSYVTKADYLVAPYVVVNAGLSPQVTVLFANPVSMAALGEPHQAWLRDAATRTAAWAVDHAADGIIEGVATSCRFGARFVRASPEQLTAVQQRMAPLLQRMRSDPATATTMAVIDDLKGRIAPSATPAIPDGCGFDATEPERPPPAPLTAPGSTEDLPLGTYRYELKPSEVVQGGGTNSILQADVTGVFTWELGPGTWRVTVSPSAPGAEDEECEGWFSVDGGVVTFTHNSAVHFRQPQCLPSVWTARWAPATDGIQWGAPSLPILTPYFTLRTWQRVR
jgi:TRAP-type C4-dicarboxylate transport system substrate-binding protein